MKHTFFLAATSPGAGLTSVSLGVFRALDRRGIKVGFCKPISQNPITPESPDPSIHFVKSTSAFNPPDPIALDDAEQYLRDDRMQDLMESHGLPGILLGPTIALEVLGGLGILFGLGTRWAALGLAGFCGLAAVVFHSNLSGHGQTIDFLENLSMAGGLLALAAAGPGAFALEHRRR